MPFGARKTSVLDSPPWFAASEVTLVFLCLPSYLTPILMVQDVLDNI